MMNCLKVDQGGGGDGMAALKEPSMASSSGVMTGAASMSAASVSVGGGGRNIRSWSSSHVDSVGESTHSKNSLVRADKKFFEKVMVPSLPHKCMLFH